jgi:hypothetical protein
MAWVHRAAAVVRYHVWYKPGVTHTIRQREAWILCAVQSRPPQRLPPIPLTPPLTCSSSWCQEGSCNCSPTGSPASPTRSG